MTEDDLIGDFEKEKQVINDIFNDINAFKS